MFEEFFAPSLRAHNWKEWNSVRTRRKNFLFLTRFDTNCTINRSRKYFWLWLQLEHLSLEFNLSFSIDFELGLKFEFILVSNFNSKDDFGLNLDVTYSVNYLDSDFSVEFYSMSLTTIQILLYEIDHNSSIDFDSDLDSNLDLNLKNVDFDFDYNIDWEFNFDLDVDYGLDLNINFDVDFNFDLNNDFSYLDYIFNFESFWISALNLIWTWISALIIMLTSIFIWSWTLTLIIPLTHTLYFRFWLWPWL
jgi:hypothetical protein